MAEAVSDSDKKVNGKATDDSSTKKTGGYKQRSARPLSGNFNTNFRNQYHDEQCFNCQFCSFMCRRSDEMGCHYREKHDYVVQKSDALDLAGYGGILPATKTSAPTRQSLIFSPSNYIFISNPGEYLLDINDAKIEGVLKYIPGFLNKREADNFFYDIKKNLDWVQLESFNKKAQKNVKEARLSCYFGPNYEYGPIKWENKTEMHAKVTELKELVQKHCGEEFNSALGIMYRTGRDHMGWHSDDEPELGKYPTIASISFGATRYFEFSRNGQPTKLVRLALKHGDLLITSGCIQEKWRHWVPRDPDVEHCRVNLTFRKVNPSLRTSSSAAVGGKAKSGAGDST